MGLLSGTKRINRDGIGEIVPMGGLLTAPTMALGADAPTNGTPYTFQPVVTSIENGTQDYTMPYNFATDPSLGGMASTLQDYATREGSQPPPIDAAQYMQMVQGDLTNRGLTLNQIDENALNGTQMKHPGTYSYLVDSSGKIAAAPQFMADTSVADGQAWLRLAATAAMGGMLGGGETAGGETLSGMDLAADGGSNALWQTGAQGTTNTLGSIPQTSSSVAPLESAPQVTAPELAQVSQVPATTSPMTYEQMLKAAEAASAAKAVAPSDTQYTDSPPPGPGSPGTSETVTPSTPTEKTYTAQDAWDSLKGYAGDIQTWAKDNPLLSKALFGAIGAAGAVSGNKSGGSGYVDSGYRPTISRGGWQANVTPTYSKPQTQAPGLLNVPTTGQQNDGLWRFGLLGKK